MKVRLGYKGRMISSLEITSSDIHFLLPKSTMELQIIVVTMIYNAAITQSNMTWYRIQ